MPDLIRCNDPLCSAPDVHEPPCVPISEKRQFGTGRFSSRAPDTELLKENFRARALNDPTVACCGRDAADCDCPPSLTTLAEKVRPAVPPTGADPDERWAEAWNAGRQAVLNAARTTRNPLAGVLTSQERQTLIAIMTWVHGNAPALAGEVTVLSHKLGLQHNG